MLHREIVARDVGLVMRDVICHWTPFTRTDPDDDKAGFHFGLVPSADLWDGWHADFGNWDSLLRRIEHALHNKNDAYRVLNVTVQDATDTLSKRLNVTLTLLVDKIMAADKAIAELAQPEAPQEDA